MRFWFWTRVEKFLFRARLGIYRLSDFLTEIDDVLDDLENAAWLKALGWEE